MGTLVLADEPERDMRIECWRRTNKAGTVNRYWQWAERAAGPDGKRRRIYGGTFAQLGADRQAAYWQRAGIHSTRQEVRG